MLTGSTSGLRPLTVLSSQFISRLVQNPSSLLHGRILSTVRGPQTVREEPDEPAAHNVSPTNNYQWDFLAVSANGAPPLSRSSLPPPVLAFPADRDCENHLVGSDSLLDTQDRQQHRVASHKKQDCGSPDGTKRKCPAQRRRTLLWVMLTAKAPARAWAAYGELLSYRVPIPPHLLHKLVRLLASIKPRTRTVHLQLLSVLKTLESNHGQLRLWEWNTLLDSAGKQWHKTSLEDYENAFDIFNKRGILPIGNATSSDKTVNAEAGLCVTQQNPDIWTYNILLSIATRSNLPLAVRHASSFLLASGLTPNRHTHLCLLGYFADRNDLHSVRSTLRKMKEQGLDVGLDGINACLWAYARNRRFDVASPIYRVLRSNVKPTPDIGEHNVNEDAQYVRDTVGLDIPTGLEPNEITYMVMIQTLSYHGDLRGALSVFVDMLSAPNREVATRIDDVTIAPPCYKASMTAFRGLFLGFSRHGRDSDYRGVKAESIARLFPSSRAIWDQETLEIVFAAFLQLPKLPKPTDRLMYWILVAFDKTSGNDSEKLREVWTKLEAKYGGGWGGRLEEIRRSIFPS